MKVTAPNGMEAFMIIASNGAEIIDMTPEAGSRYKAMQDLQEKFDREKRWKEAGRKRKLSYKLRSACGLL